MVISKLFNMKTNKFRSILKVLRIFLLIFTTLLFTRCVGPEGPAGFDGRDGEDGIDGIDGINYTHSAIYDINPSDWTGDVNGYDVYIDVPEITQDIYYNGAVLVYRLIEVEPISFNMLPYTYVDNSLAVYLDYDAYIGGIDLMYKEVLDGVNDTPVIENTMSFKVVIIEGIPLAKLKGIIDVTDYSAVAKMFNITGAKPVL